MSNDTDTTIALTKDYYEAVIASLRAQHALDLHQADVHYAERLQAQTANDRSRAVVYQDENSRLLSTISQLRAELSALKTKDVTDVKLDELFTGTDQYQKITRIKIVRDAFGLGLKEAKDVVDSYYNRHGLDNAPRW